MNMIKNSNLEIATAQKFDLNEQIERLSNDKSWNVRTAVAKKSNLSKEQIEILTNDKNQIVRSLIAQRLDLTKDQITRLSKDEDWSVRYHAQKPNEAEGGEV